MTTLTHGSLFSGIGGFDLGFGRAGIKTLWQVEIDDYATKILEKNFPEAKRYRDIRSVHGPHETAGRLHSNATGEGRDGAGGVLAPVQIVSGGFPCVDVSNAGKRKGIAEGTRSGLWKEYLRLVGEMRPRYVVVENVGALAYRGLWIVAGGLSEVGYDSEWEAFQASDFGLPHKRERIFLVAYPQGFACGHGRVFPEFRTGRYKRQLDQRAARVPGGTRIIRRFELAHSARLGRSQGEILHGREQEERRKQAEGQLRLLGAVPACGGGIQLADAAGEPILPCKIHDGADSEGRCEEAPAGRQVEDAGWGVLSLYRGSSGRVWQAPESAFSPVADGLPTELAQWRACGNAVVPAIAEHIARCIVAFDARQPDPNHKHTPHCAPRKARSGSGCEIVTKREGE